METFFFRGEHLRRRPRSLASSIPVHGLERVCPRKGFPWPRFFYVLVLEPCVLDSSSARDLFPMQRITKITTNILFAISLCSERTYCGFKKFFCFTDSNNLGKEVDLQNHIKAISSNFVGFNIFLLTAKHIERFRLKTIKPSSGYYKQ